MELKDIKTLIDLMKKNDLSVFKMEKEGFKITLKKGHDFQPIISAPPAAMLPAAPAAASQPAAVESDAPSGKEITSPMVGTFYSQSSPETPPYVSVGQEVTADTVVCIIEAMKVMNEIKAEQAGIITDVLVESGKAVQFGQPMFRLK